MTSLSVEEFKLFKVTGVQLLDSRPTNEFASSVIPNSVNASLNGLTNIWLVLFSIRKTPSSNL